MSRKTLVFHSVLTPAAVRDTLARTTDREQRAFTISGYRGEQPLLSIIGEDTFRLRKRQTYFRNDFARQLYAQFMPEQGGTRIEAYFEVSRITRYFMRFWLAGAVLISTPLFVMSVRDAFAASRTTSGDLWIGLLVPPALVFACVFFPRIGQFFGRGEERFILQFVQGTLVAQYMEPTYIPQ